MKKKSIFLFEVDYIWLFFLVLIECKFFYIFRLPGTLGTQANSLLIVFASILSFFIFFFKKGLFDNNNYLFSKYVFFVLVIMIIELIYTMFTYPKESKIDSVKETLPFFTLLSYFFLAYMMKKNFLKTITFLVNCSSITALLFCIQALFYNVNFFSFLNIYGFNYGNIEKIYRAFGIRLIGSSFIEYIGFLSLGLLFSKYVPKNKKKIFLINIILVGNYLLFVSQTRSLLVMYLICMLCILLIRFKSKLSIFFFGVVLITLVYNFRIELYNMWLTFQTDWSFIHRIDAITYYVKCFLQSPIFGNGLLRDNPSSIYNYQIVHGNALFGYSYNDVGLIGHLAHYGILGFIMYILYFFIVFKNIRINNKFNTICYDIIISSALSLINLSLYDAGRIFELVVYMATLDGSIDYFKKIFW